MGILVLFHDDMDGRCSAAIVKKVYPEARCYEVNYSDPLPIDEILSDDTVFIVDYTPSKDCDFERIVSKAAKTVWIDHHGKNIVRHKFFDKCLDGLRVEKTPSGAGCCWKYLFPKVPVPDAVLYVSDYDTWTYDFGIVTKAFEAGLKTVAHSPEDPIWDALLDTDNDLRRQKETQNIVVKGNIVLEFRKNFFKDIATKGSFTCDFEGHKILCCNMPGVGSNLFEGMDTEGYDIVSTFYSDGSKIIVGLYSEGETVDCSELAMKHGGGGHKGAAGFECENLPFTNIEKVS